MAQPTVRLTADLPLDLYNWLQESAKRKTDGNVTGRLREILRAEQEREIAMAPAAHVELTVEEETQ